MLLGLIISFPMLRKFSTIISSKIFSVPFFFSSSSGTHITQMLVRVIMSQRSLKLSSILFILFPLFCSKAVISATLSSSSLICSSNSVILLLVPSRVFLISVIVLSVCLFFISSMSLVIVLTVLIVSYIFSILFSSLWSILLSYSEFSFR